MRKYNVSKVPSCWCQWILIHQKRDASSQQEFNNSNEQPQQKEEREETLIVWDGVKKSYEYMYWLQYFVDFITVSVKEQFDIEIENFDGTIMWRGKLNK